MDLETTPRARWRWVFAGRAFTALALPLSVAGVLRLAVIADPFVRRELGAALGPLIEAMDLCAAINIYLMLVFYLPALVTAIPSQRPSRAWRLIAGINVGWSGSLLLFSSLAWAYGTLARDVIRDSPVLPVVRLTYLLLVLVGSTAHIATAVHGWLGWWRTIVSWLAVAAALIVALTVAGMHGYPLDLGWMTVPPSIPAQGGAP